MGFDVLQTGPTGRFYAYLDTRREGGLIFELIEAEKAHFPVKLMCHALGVSRSGLYAWRRRPVPGSAKEVFIYHEYACLSMVITVEENANI